jgi:hypothetical protein
VQTLSDFVMTPPITLNSRWRGKQVPIKVVVTRVSVRQVSYVATDESASGTVSECSSSCRR